MKRIQVLLSMLLVSLTILIISCEKDTKIIDTNNPNESILNERFKSYEIVEIDNDILWEMLEAQEDESVNLDMKNATSNTDIASLSFTLNRKQVLTDDFKVHLIREGNQAEKADILKPYVLSGQIDGNEGTAFMIVNNENFRAQFTIDGEIHRLEPLSDHLEDAISGKYISYNVNDVIVREGLTCDVDDKQLDLIGEQQEDDLHERAAGNCLKIEVTAMGDFELYAWRFGYNFNNTFNWMLWRILQADNFYNDWNGYPIDLLVKSIYINTWNGYITHSWDCTNVLYQWQNFAVNNSWFQRGDVNILFTGKNLSGSVIGCAWIGTICNYNYGYNWGQGSFCWVEHQWNPWYEDITTAHEIGHLLGANHTNGGFMNAYINGQSWMHPSTWNDLNNWVWGHSWCMGNWGCQW